MRRNETDTLRARATGLIRRWAAKLPADGWEGTARELSDALQDECDFGEWIGPNPTAWVERALVGTGFHLSRSRTRDERLVRIVKGKA